MNHKALFVLGLLVAAGHAAANDGWIGNGGSPKLMAPHPTVRMLREKVRIYVDKDKITVEADFWFRNGGPTTSTNVGFPDESSDPGETPDLKGFRSWIDGKPVATKFETSEADGNWHVKRVTFPKGKIVHIRDRYTTALGVGRLGNYNTFTSYVAYTVHTGSSWKGTIGETDLRVYIRKPLPYPKRVAYTGYFNSEARDFDARAKVFVRRHHHTVFPSGIARPRKNGRELIFIRRNWRPTEDDDLHISFNARRDVALERRIQGD